MFHFSWMLQWWKACIQYWPPKSINFMGVKSPKIAEHRLGLKNRSTNGKNASKFITSVPGIRWWLRGGFGFSFSYTLSLSLFLSLSLSLKCARKIINASLSLSLCSTHKLTLFVVASLSFLIVWATQTSTHTLVLKVSLSHRLHFLVKISNTLYQANRPTLTPFGNTHSTSQSFSWKRHLRTQYLSPLPLILLLPTTAAGASDTRVSE